MSTYALREWNFGAFRPNLHLENIVNIRRYIASNWNIVKISCVAKTSSQASATLVRNYDWLTDLLTRVTCRATSVAKKYTYYLPLNFIGLHLPLTWFDLQLHWLALTLLAFTLTFRLWPHAGIQRSLSCPSEKYWLTFKTSYNSHIYFIFLVSCVEHLYPLNKKFPWLDVQENLWTPWTFRNTCGQWNGTLRHNLGSWRRAGGCNINSGCIRSTYCFNCSLLTAISTLATVLLSVFIVTIFGLWGNCW